MADPQTGPEAFEEFLALPLEGVASTAFPFFAALAVVLVSRMWLALTHRELGLVALGFAAFVLVWGWGTPYERLAKSPPGDGLAA